MDPAVSGGPPGDEIERQAAYAVAALPPDGYPLLAVLVRRSTLADIDPEAAAAIAEESIGRSDAAWYVRGLHRSGDPSRIDWLVVDAVNERTLASGAISTRTANVGGAP